MCETLENGRNKYVKTITAYTLPYGFIIEADQSEEVTDFYIYHKDYGIKMLMFGICNCDVAEHDEIVRANATQYMLIYTENYMD